MVEAAHKLQETQAWRPSPPDGRGGAASNPLSSRGHSGVCRQGQSRSGTHLAPPGDFWAQCWDQA